MPAPAPPTRLATGSVLMLIGGAIAVAFAPIFAKIAMQDGGVGASASAFWRIFLALPFFLFLQLRQSNPVRLPGGRPLRSAFRFHAILAVPGIIFALDLAVWHSSFHYTTAASATLLANLQVILVGVVGWIALGERHRPVFGFGALLALIGVALMINANARADQAAAPNPLLGDALGLLTAVFYGGYLLSIKSLRRRFPSAQILLVSGAASAVILFAICMATGEVFIATSARAWWALVGLAVVPHCIGQMLIVTAMSRLPVSFTGVTLLLQPATVMLLGWIMLGEALNPAQIGAGVLVLLGIEFARRGVRAQPTPQPVDQS